MTKKQAWVKALRLRTLPLSLSGIILGSFIAKSKGFWDTTVFMLAILTTVLFQIVSNLANDLGDSLKGTDNDQRIGPTRAVQSGLITVQEMKIAVIFSAILSFISASLLIYFGTQTLDVKMVWFYFALALICVIAAITYTIGKKAYGYQGLGDLMVFLFFGWVSVMGVYPLFTKSMDVLLFLPASAIGLLSAAVLNLNNMRDIKNDKASQKKTLVVLLGSDLAKFYHVFLILSAILCLGIYIHLSNQLWGYIGLIPFLVLFIHLRKVLATKDPKAFDPELKKVALITFAIALLTSLGLNLNF